MLQIIIPPTVDVNKGVDWVIIPLQLIQGVHLNIIIGLGNCMEPSRHKMSETSMHPLKLCLLMDSGSL